MTNLVLKPVQLTFLDKTLNHVEVSPGEFNVVLEDVVKAFANITDSGNRSRLIATCIDDVLSGTQP